MSTLMPTITTPTADELACAFAVFPYGQIAYVELDEEHGRISRVIDRVDGDVTKNEYPGPRDHDGEHTFLGRLQNDTTLRPLIAALHAAGALPPALAIPDPQKDPDERP